jgi:hypothetical protein
MKVGESCTCMMFNVFIDSEDGNMVVDNGIKIPRIHLQDQNDEKKQPISR